MRPGRALLWAAAALLLAVLLFPIAGLLREGLPSVLAGGLLQPVIGQALAVSFATSLAALFLAILLGTPLGWLLANRRGPASSAAALLVQLPIVLPPSLAGVALLFAFGRRGFAGALLAHLGISLAFTPAAVILAQLFVASPYYVQAAASAFRAVDPRLVQVARTLGASPLRAFVRVTLPLSMPALRGGAALAWARALGEFGATLLFAGNLPGATQTLPLAIYTALESDARTAAALGLVLLAFAVGLLVVARHSALALFSQAVSPRSEQR